MEEEKIANVPYFIHEAVCDKMERANEAMAKANADALEKMDKSNKRLLYALVAVCVTLIITVCSFLVAYRNMNVTWMDFLENRIEEVNDGGLFDKGATGNHSNALEG